MQTSNDESQQLFYNEIIPWVAKLQKTVEVVNDLIDVDALPENDANKKERYESVANEANKLNNDPQFNVLVLEGMGGDIGKKTYNVEIAYKNLTPFVAYMLQKAKK